MRRTKNNTIELLQYCRLYFSGKVFLPQILLLNQLLRMCVNSKINHQVQGPWGPPNNDGEMFCDGIFTFIKRILVHYDKGPTNIWYMELEYDVNGTSLVVGHGRKDYGNAFATVS